MTISDDEAKAYAKGAGVAPTELEKIAHVHEESQTIGEFLNWLMYQRDPKVYLCTDATPVGSEVVMIASVFDSKGFGEPRRKIEWMIASGGVGQFISPGQRASWVSASTIRARINGKRGPRSTLTPYARRSPIARRAI